MASLWTDSRTDNLVACITTIVGSARQQIKRTTGTADKKLARRIADELEEAGQGRRSSEQIKTFLGTIPDLCMRRVGASVV